MEGIRSGEFSIEGGFTASVPSEVITAMMYPTWHTKYRMPDEFLDWFLTEQEYIDAMFVQMIMANYGLWIDIESLLVTV
jgi:hypothetical protein